MVEESFTFSVHYKDQDHHLEAVLQQYGYSYRLHIPINGLPVFFEPDEERNYRAILPPETGQKKDIDPQFLQAIAARLEEIFK